MKSHIDKPFTLSGLKRSEDLMTACLGAAEKCCGPSLWTEDELRQETNHAIDQLEDHGYIILTASSLQCRSVENQFQVSVSTAFAVCALITDIL